MDAVSVLTKWIGNNLNGSQLYAFERFDLQLIPAHRELPLSTDGGFSFSAGV